MALCTDHGRLSEAIYVSKFLGVAENDVNLITILDGGTKIVKNRFTTHLLSSTSGILSWSQL